MGLGLIGLKVPSPSDPRAVKEQLRELLLQAIRTLQQDATLPADLEVPNFVI